MRVIYRSCACANPYENKQQDVSFTVIKRIPNPLRGDWIVRNYKQFYGATGEGSLLWSVTGSQFCPLPDVLDCGVTYTSLNRNRV